MADIITTFSIHVGSGVSLGQGCESGQWHRAKADYYEREIRDFIGALAAELRLSLGAFEDLNSHFGANDYRRERLASISALLAAHPSLTEATATDKS